jgi:tetratricopeptide (TPR) repeat protein
MLRSFLIGILAASAPAFAQERPDIAVVGLHQDTLDVEAQKAAVAALVGAIEKDKKFEGLNQDDVASRVAGREGIVLEEAFMGPGRKLLEDGRILYEQAQPGDAIPILQEAVDSLRVGIATANQSRDLWDAWMYLGTAYFATEQRDQANRAWAAAAALAPARNPNPAKFPPDVIAAFDELRQARVGASSVVTVASDSADTTVYLNGEARGTAPAVLNGVLPGENHIVARSATGGHAYQMIDVSPGQAQTVQIKMGSPTLGTGGDSKFARARQATALYRTLGARAAVDLVVIAGTVDDRLMLQLYSVTADAFSAPMSVPFEGSATDEAVAAMPTLLGLVGADGSVKVDETAANAIAVDVGDNKLLAQMLLSPAPPKITTGGGGELPPPPPKRTGLWIALGGVGVAAVGGGIAAWQLSSTEEPEPVSNGTITVGPFE